MEEYGETTLKQDFTGTNSLTYNSLLRATIKVDVVILTCAVVICAIELLLKKLKKKYINIFLRTISFLFALISLSLLIIVLSMDFEFNSIIAIFIPAILLLIKAFLKNENTRKKVNIIFIIAFIVLVIFLEIYLSILSAPPLE